MRIQLTVFTSIICICLTVIARPQDKAAGPADKSPPEKQMAEQMAAIQPGPMHQKLAKMAGRRRGRRTIRNAFVGGAPRSMAASSYSLPIDNSRARTMMTG